MNNVLQGKHNTMGWL